MSQAPPRRSWGAKGQGFGLALQRKERTAWMECLQRLSALAQRDISPDSKISLVDLYAQLDILDGIELPNSSLTAQDCGAMAAAVSKAVINSGELAGSRASQFISRLYSLQKGVVLTSAQLSIVLDFLLAFLLKSSGSFLCREAARALAYVALEHGDTLSTRFDDILPVLLQYGNPASPDMDCRAAALEGLTGLCAKNWTGLQDRQKGLVCEVMALNFVSHYRTANSGGGSDDGVKVVAAAASGLAQISSHGKGEACLAPYITRIVLALNHIIQPQAPTTHETSNNSNACNQNSTLNGTANGNGAIAQPLPSTPNRTHSNSALRKGGQAASERARIAAKVQALNLLAVLAKHQPQDLYTHWGLFFATHSTTSHSRGHATTSNNTTGSSPVPPQPTVLPPGLVEVIEYDDSPEVRAAAAGAASSLISNAPLKKWLLPPTSTVSANTHTSASMLHAGGLGGRVLPMLQHLQSRIAVCLGKEQSVTVTVKLCSCSVGLVTHVPHAGGGDAGARSVPENDILGTSLLSVLRELARILINPTTDASVSAAAHQALSASFSCTPPPAAAAALLACRDFPLPRDVNSSPAPYSRTTASSPESWRSSRTGAKCASPSTSSSTYRAGPSSGYISKFSASREPPDVNAHTDSKGSKMNRNSENMSGAGLIDRLLANAGTGGRLRAESLGLLARILRVYPWALGQSASSLEDARDLLRRCFGDVDQNIRLHALKVIEDLLRGRLERCPPSQDASNTSTHEASVDNIKAEGSEVWEECRSVVLADIRRAVEDPFHGVRAVACMCFSMLLHDDWASMTMQESELCLNLLLIATRDTAGSVSTLACKAIGVYLLFTTVDDASQSSNTTSKDVELSRNGPSNGITDTNSRASSVRRRCIAGLLSAASDPSSSTCSQSMASLSDVVSVLATHALSAREEEESVGGWCLCSEDVMSICKTALMLCEIEHKASASAVRAVGALCCLLCSCTTSESDNSSSLDFVSKLDGMLSACMVALCDGCVKSGGKGAVKAANWCTALARSLCSRGVRLRMRSGAAWGNKVIAALCEATDKGISSGGAAGGKSAIVSATALLSLGIQPSSYCNDMSPVLSCALTSLSHVTNGLDWGHSSAAATTMISASTCIRALAIHTLAVCGIATLTHTDRNSHKSTLQAKEEPEWSGKLLNLNVLTDSLPMLCECAPALIEMICGEQSTAAAKTVADSWLISVQEHEEKETNIEYIRLQLLQVAELNQGGGASHTHASASSAPLAALLHCAVAGLLAAVFKEAASEGSSCAVPLALVSRFETEANRRLASLSTAHTEEDQKDDLDSEL